MHGPASMHCGLTTGLMYLAMRPAARRYYSIGSPHGVTRGSASPESKTPCAKPCSPAVESIQTVTLPPPRVSLSLSLSLSLFRSLYIHIYRCVDTFNVCIYIYVNVCAICRYVGMIRCACTYIYLHLHICMCSFLYSLIHPHSKEFRRRMVWVSSTP